MHTCCLCDNPDCDCGYSHTGCMGCSDCQNARHPDPAPATERTCEKKARVVSHLRITRAVVSTTRGLEVGSVTGPGRSGAIASAIASHILGVPFIPFGQEAPIKLGRLLIIDTARSSGRTLRRAERRYKYANPVVVACFEEPPRVAFWYERKYLSEHFTPKENNDK